MLPYPGHIIAQCLISAFALLATLSSPAIAETLYLSDHVTLQSRPPVTWHGYLLDTQTGTITTTTEVFGAFAWQGNPLIRLTPSGSLVCSGGTSAYCLDTATRTRKAVTLNQSGKGPAHAWDIPRTARNSSDYRHRRMQRPGLRRSSRWEPSAS